MIEKMTEGDKPNFLMIGPILLIVTMFLPYSAEMTEYIYTDDDWMSDDIEVNIPGFSGFDYLEAESTKMLIAAVFTVIPLVIFLANKYEGMEQIVTGCFAGVALMDLVMIMDVLELDTESFPVGIGLIFNIGIAGFFAYISYKAASER